MELSDLWKSALVQAGAGVYVYENREVERVHSTDCTGYHAQGADKLELEKIVENKWCW